MPIVDGIEQQTPDWLAIRVGIVTGSRMADVMAYKLKGGEKADRANYRAELVCEILTGISYEHYISKEMKWGLENEEFARNAYEIKVDSSVEQAGSFQERPDPNSQFSTYVDRVGFALHSAIKRFGASPDGLVGKDGLVEFKCPTSLTHIEYIKAGIVPVDYHWQMLAEMACTEREWCDFVSYDPRLPKKQQLFIRRFARDDARIAEMEAEIVKFLGEVDADIEKLKKAKMMDLDTTLVSKLKESLGDA